MWNAIPASHQSIPNTNEVRCYSGKNNNVKLTVSRLLYRDQQHKCSLNQSRFFGSTTLDAYIRWQRGTRAWSALPAPEEARHEGSARSRASSGADYGRVDGPGTKYLVGHQLASSAVGVRGALLCRFSYDLFAGLSVYKLEGFHTSGVTAGFCVNLEI